MASSSVVWNKCSNTEWVAALGTTCFITKNELKFRSASAIVVIQKQLGLSLQLYGPFFIGKQVCIMRDLPKRHSGKLDDACKGKQQNFEMFKNFFSNLNIWELEPEGDLNCVYKLYGDPRFQPSRLTCIPALMWPLSVRISARLLVPSMLRSVVCASRRVARWGFATFVMLMVALWMR